MFKGKRTSLYIRVNTVSDFWVHRHGHLYYFWSRHSKRQHSRSCEVCQDLVWHVLGKLFRATGTATPSVWQLDHVAHFKAHPYYTPRPHDPLAPLRAIVAFVCLFYLLKVWTGNFLCLPDLRINKTPNFPLHNHGLKVTQLHFQSFGFTFISVFIFMKLNNHATKVKSPFLLLLQNLASSMHFTLELTNYEIIYTGAQSTI